MSNIQLSASTTETTQTKIPATALQYRQMLGIAALVVISLLYSAQPAAAHHAMGGKTPTNFFEGFLSGIAHPVIGLDHLAFVIAIGLLSAGAIRGAFIPAGFVLAAMAGTGIHLQGLQVPGAEIIISLSVIGFGILVALPNRPNWIALLLLGAAAGVFHGYAYGESIYGAGMTPVVAYLLGFSLVQYVIALAARQVGNIILQQSEQPLLSSKIRLAGGVILGMGVVFLSNSIFAA